MEMKPITEKEVLKNRFVRICKNEYWQTMVERKRPTWEEAQRMRTRTLCIYIGVCGLRLRPVDGATANANYWLEDHTKKEILEQFRHEFVQNKDRKG